MTDCLPTREDAGRQLLRAPPARSLLFVEQVVLALRLLLLHFLLLSLYFGLCGLGGCGGSGAWDTDCGTDLGGNIDADPLFADAAGGDYSLLAGSPCIDSGDNALLPPDVADLDGDGTVAFDGVTIDTTSLTIPGAWAQGDAIVLNPSFTTAAGNDVAANWCIARAADAFGSDGNHGTPGAVNACP